MFEKEAEKYVKVFTDRSHIWSNDKLMQLQLREAYKDGAEFGYNKAKEEIQSQEYSMSYENGIFKCKYKTGKIFESVDGKTWKEKEIE